MKRLAALCSALGLVAVLGIAPATEAALISFDTTPGGAGGTITYDGAGGPAIGTGIAFVDIEGMGTPLNNNVVLSCTSCLLNFQTGANRPRDRRPGRGRAVGRSYFTETSRRSGSSTRTSSSDRSSKWAPTPGLTGENPTAMFIATGVDVKNQTLLDFYGLTNSFVFANTEIALGTFVSDPATGAFTATPNQADIINTIRPRSPRPRSPCRRRGSSCCSAWGSSRPGGSPSRPPLAPSRARSTRARDG